MARILAVDDSEPMRQLVEQTLKTGGHEGGNTEGFLDNELERYRAQLNQYATLVAALPGTDRGPIRLALYFPMLSGWREWAWQPEGRH